jgi:OmpA-OmpF porin, OOP family
MPALLTGRSAGGHAFRTMGDGANVQASAAPSALALPRMTRSSILLAAALLAACAKQAPDNNVVVNAAATAAPAATPSPMPTPSATPVAAAGGFDPAAAPLATGTLGAWPYFGLIAGYTKMTPENSPSYEGKKWLESVDYERFQFFDGTKLIPVEGRAYVTRAMGTAQSFFGVEKSYEKLVHDLGGVTVFEGTGQPMDDRKLKFADNRYRGQYRLQDDKMGVYMARFADKQLWVEVYQPWDDDKGYWLTVMETKPLDVKVQLIPAEQMKQALDSAGHVALYINFDTDKATIRPDSQPIIAQIVKLLTDNPQLKLEVQGHTDNSGTADHNQTLSAARANAVAGSLIAQGIAMDRLVPKGYGQTKPIADNGTDDGKAKNRRVELVKR